MKYKLTDETKEWFGVILHRVQYDDGVQGGWIENERNLSGNAHVYGDAQVSGDAQVFGDAQVSGNAWVFGDAQVSGNAHVSGHAWVSGNAQVFEDADWMVIGPIGSRDCFTTVFRETDRIAVSCGCFYGSLDEFEKQVSKTHGDNEYGTAYREMIRMAKIRFAEGAKE